MSFPRYPAYKDSGLEWLGEVPEHWVVKRIASLYREVVEQGSDELPVLSVSIHHGVSDSELSEEEMDRKVTRSEDRSKYKRVSAGDLVYNMMRAWQGAFGTVCVEGMVSPAYVVARPTSIVPSTWIEYLLRTDPAINEIKRFSRGITDFRLRLYWDEFKNLRVCLPPCNERDALLEFLDRETAKIDALIAEQQRLIELLQEKRQAVISQAVTKGLNPEAPMKDSGVEWLGEVPEHWTLKRLKHLSPNLTVGIVVNPSEYVSDEGLPFVYGGDIREGVIDWENSRRIAPAMSDKQAKTRLRSGDLLMVRVGAPGITAVVPAECEGGNCASVMLIRQGSFSSQWLCFTLNTRIVRFQVEVVQYGAAQEQFNISHAVNFWLPVPPRQEQDRIATFLLSEHEKAQGLILQAQNAVSLLQERRSALISAAVTGQIDVRGLVPEASAA